MPLEKTDVIVINRWDSIQLDEYNGKYSLNAIQNGDNETFYLKWSYKVEHKNGESVPGKIFPVKVALGDTKEQAIETLKMLLAELGDTGCGSGSQGQNVPDDDIPF